MHPDKKVGLSLAILLIGITVAFFFRNESPEGASRPPRLASAERLDDRIRQQQTQTPYLPSHAEETGHSDNAGSGGSGAASGNSATAGNSRSVGDVPQVPSVNSQALDQQSQQAGQAPPPRETLPPPIQASELPSARDGTGPATPTGHGVARANSGSATSGTTASGESGFHDVAAKETLSQISEKRLGTSRRWKEILEANRDLLKNDPNGLRPGMRLKLPAAGPTRSAANAPAAAAPVSTPTTRQTAGTGTSNPAPAATEPAAPGAAPAAAPSFTRPSRPPVVPRRTLTTQPNRNLSQAAPPDLPELRGFDARREIVASRRDDDSADSEATDSRPPSAESGLPPVPQDD